MALRHLQSGEVWLFDCGEGTQIQLQRCRNIKGSKIRRVFISHLHGDHVFGLPGLMCTLSMQTAGINTETIAEEAETLHIYGPKGLRHMLRVSLTLSQSDLGYRYAVHELLDVPGPRPLSDAGEAESATLHSCELPGENLYPIATGSTVCWELPYCEPVKLVAAPLQHGVPSVGYVMRCPPEPGQLDADKAVRLGVPRGPLLGKLKNGESVQLADGRQVTPEQVVHPPTPGLCVAVLGDSSDSSAAVQAAAGAHVVVHEATLEDGLKQDAIRKGHSTPSMAADFARQVQAKCLILTHFSQRYMPPDKCGEHLSSDVLLQEARAALPEAQVEVANDFTCFSLSKGGGAVVPSIVEKN